MKKITIYLILNLSYLISSGQSASINQSFIKLYDNMLSAVPGSDSSLIFFGDSRYYGKLDKTGSIPWYKDAPYSDASASFKLIGLPNATFCSFGYFYTGPGDPTGSVVIFDKNGEFKQSKSYSLVGSLEDGIQIETTRLLAVGSTQQYAYSFNLMKMDLTGKPVLSAKISEGGIIFQLGGATLNKINNNLFLITLPIQDRSSVQSDIATIAVDTALKVVWARTIGNAKKDDFPVCGADIENYHFTISKTQSFGEGMNDILVNCMDNSGTVIWDKTYGTSTMDEIPTAVSIDKDSSLLISGYSQDAKLKQAGLLLKISKTGQLLWSRQYTAPNGYKNTSLLYANQTFNGIHAVASIIDTVSKQPRTEFMILKTNGEASCRSSKIVLKENTIIRISETINLTRELISPVETSNTIINTYHTQGLTPLCANPCAITANFSASKTRICKGGAVNFFNTSTPADSIKWLIDGQKESNNNAFSHVFATAGEYQVTLIAYEGICKDTLREIIIVDDLPHASFSSTQEGLNGYFTNLSPKSESFLWKPGDGTTVFSKDMSHTFPKVGFYNVCLIATNACAADTACQLFNSNDYRGSFLTATYLGPSLTTANTRIYGMGICQDPSGKLILAIADEDGYVGNDNDIAMLRIDENGKVLKQTMLSHGDINPGKIYSLGERGYLILATGGTTTIIMDSSLSITTLTSSISNFGAYSALEAANKRDIYLSGANSTGKSVVLKMNKYGKRIWTKTALANANISSLIELKDGNVIGVGRTTTGEGSLVKFSGTSGDMIWSKYYTTSGTLDARYIFYDSLQNSLYIAGTLNATFNDKAGCYILKTDLDGNIIWSKAFRNESVNNVACFKNQFGQVFLCYSDWRNNIVQLNDSGEIKWAKAYSLKTVTNSLSISQYTLCQDGGIAGCGSANYGITYYAVAMKADTSGNNSNCLSTPQTLTPVNQTFTLEDAVFDLGENFSATDGVQGYYNPASYLYESSKECAGNSCSENLKFTSSIAGIGTQYQFNYIKTTAVNLHWDFGDGGTATTSSPLHTYSGPGKYKICLTGFVKDCGTVSYCDSILIVATTINEEAGKNKLSIFPNPFVGSTNIAYTLEKRSFVTIDIYNALGQLIKTLANGEQTEGNYTYTYTYSSKYGNAGIYLLKFTIDGSTFVKRIEEIK
jgi:PKD repeat protein